jgi:hypothetical protein
MEQRKQAGKDSVKNWFNHALERRCPPPDPKQIRRELGWDLLRLERGQPRQR